MVRKLPTLKAVLFAMTVAGLHPEKQNILSHILKLLAFISISFIASTNLMELFFNWQGIKTVANVPMFPVILMICVKWSFLIIKNKELHLILKKLDQFWDLDRFGPSVEERVLVPHGRAAFLLYMFISTACSVGVIIILITLFTSLKILVYPGYKLCDFNVPPCFEYQFAWQTISNYVQLAPAALGYDALFVQFVTYGYSALELLKYAFEEMSELNEFVENQKFVDDYMKEIIDQHNIILEYIKMLNAFYKDVLLIQCCSSLASLICSLYMITYDGIPPKLSVLGHHGMMYGAVSMQLIMFCVGGAILMDQTSTVADAAFAVDWSIRTQPKLRKQLAFIIQRSHKVEKLSIGNMVVMNLVTYVTILKNSISIYTLLLNLESSSTK